MKPNTNTATTTSFDRNLVYLFLLATPFSHAPSIIGPLVTFPGILSLVILVRWALGKWDRRFFISLVLLVSYMLLVSAANLEYVTIKSIPYVAAYVWFILFFAVAATTPSLDPAIVKKVLYIALAVSGIYSLVESYAHLDGLDIGAWIPRYDREQYRFWTPFLFFRTRAFNYESANWAMYINVVAASLMYLEKDSRRRLWILAASATLLLHTLSLVQIFLFAFFLMALVLRTRGAGRLFLVLSFVVIGVVAAPALSTLIDFALAKLNGGDSTVERQQLLADGLNLLAINPFFGIGAASFYHFITTGINNFYLLFAVQFGLFGLLLLLGILAVLVFGRATRWDMFLAFSFIFAYSHLLLIGDFWLPQLFIPLFVKNSFGPAQDQVLSEQSMGNRNGSTQG